MENNCLKISSTYVEEYQKPHLVTVSSDKYDDSLLNIKIVAPLKIGSTECNLGIPITHI